MNTILIAFVAGVAGFHLLPLLPDQRCFWLAAVIPLCGIFPRLRPAAALLAGFLWCFAFAIVQLKPGLPGLVEGEDLLLTGVISSIPERQSRFTRFEIDVSTLTSEDREILGPKKLRLSWYAASPSLEPGQVWRLKVRLKRPRGLQNPGGFDYEQWLFSRGIQATGYVRDWQGNGRLGESYQGERLDRLRQWIGREISSQVTDDSSSALILALAIGDRSGMSSADWSMFSRTGTSHLIAISGLHIGMIAGVMFLLGQGLWRRSEWLTLRLPASRAGAGLALIAAAAYAALAGFSLPTQRALVMLCLGLGALLLGRTLSLGRSFSLALFGVVLIDPLAPLSAGFWLSFGAVAVILLTTAGRKARLPGWRQWGRIQWVIALGLAPVLFYLFGRSSLIAPLVNLILVPWFSLVLVPTVLAVIPLLKLPLLAGPLLGLTEVLADITLAFLSWSSQLPFALVHLPDLPHWVWLAGLAGAFYLLLPKGLPGRPIGLLLIAPMLVNTPERPQQGEVLFTLLDVGQGLSCVVETAGHVLVYDTGPAFASGFNTAERVLIPYLHSRGIEEIDRLIISNGDSDHAGGVAALLDAMEVASIRSGEQIAGWAVDPCRAGEDWEWDGVRFQLLHPGDEDRFTKSNDASCVLRVETAGGALLIPGDVERAAERLLVRRYGKALQADILIAPHHGSNTSSTADFVERVTPNLVLFPTGYRNRFGFPSASVVARWQAVGADTLNTADTGAIQLRVGGAGEGAEPALYRLRNPHYWSAIEAAIE